MKKIITLLAICPLATAGLAQEEIPLSPAEAEALAKAQAQEPELAGPTQQQADAAQRPAPCGDSEEDDGQSSGIAKETGSAVGATAAQIGAASLGPIGMAAAAVFGAHAGSKAGGVIKGKKKKRKSEEAAERCRTTTAQAGD
jgi:hypothetical protein